MGEVSDVTTTFREAGPEVPDGVCKSRLDVAVRLLLVHSHRIDSENLQLVPVCQASPTYVQSARCTLHFVVNPTDLPEIGSTTEVRMVPSERDGGTVNFEALTAAGAEALRDCIPHEEGE